MTATMSELDTRKRQLLGFLERAAAHPGMSGYDEVACQQWRDEQAAIDGEIVSLSGQQLSATRADAERVSNYQFDKSLDDEGREAIAKAAGALDAAKDKAARAIKVNAAAVRSAARELDRVRTEHGQDARWPSVNPVARELERLAVTSLRDG